MKTALPEPAMRLGRNDVERLKISTHVEKCLRAARSSHRLTGRIERSETLTSVATSVNQRLCPRRL
jgi:hypothetical protein